MSSILLGIMLNWLKSLFYLGPSAEEEIAREQAIIDRKCTPRKVQRKTDGYQDRSSDIFHLCNFQNNSGHGVEMLGNEESLRLM